MSSHDRGWQAAASEDALVSPGPAPGPPPTAPDNASVRGWIPLTAIVITALAFASSFVFHRLLPASTPVWVQSILGSVFIAVVGTGTVWVALARPLQRLVGALRLSESHARQALDELRLRRIAIDGHAITSETDAEGRIIHVSDAFCRISGYSREELLGRTHRILNSGFHPREFWMEMHATLARDGVWQAEVCNRARDGSLYWLDTTVVAFRNGRGEIVGYSSLRSDITLRRQAEELLDEHSVALARIQHDLVDSQSRVDIAQRSKDEFLANMSHEIRTPMMSILGFAEMLCDAGPQTVDQDVHRQAIAAIRSSATQLLSLLNDALDLSGIQAGEATVEWSRCSPRQAMIETEALLRLRAKARGLVLRVEQDGPLPESIESDPARIRQILGQLVERAITVTESGEVRIIARLTQAEYPVIQYDVIDGGNGYSAEEQSRLLCKSEPDVAGSARSALGLGLTIARRSAELLGGHINICASAPGAGSTLRLTIPTGSLNDVTMLQAGQFEEAREEPWPAVSPKLPPGKRVLVVEDSPEIQKLLVFNLSQAGADVTVVSSGRAAVETALLAQAPGGRPFDLILMDMQMPEMNGFEATRMLRRRGHHKPIIAVTAYAMSDDRKKCLEAGCDEYVVKPIDHHKLLCICARYLGVSRAGDPPSATVAAASEPKTSA